MQLKIKEKEKGKKEKLTLKETAIKLIATTEKKQCKLEENRTIFFKLLRPPKKTTLT